MPIPTPQDIHGSVDQLAAALAPVDQQTISVSQCAGRFLAQPLTADRDSPALSVSAMDGYALRLSDVHSASLPIAFTTKAGDPPGELPPHSVVQIFTGAPVPKGTDCVVKREDTVESTDSIVLKLQPADLRSDLHVRKQGENIRQGAEVIPAGIEIDPASIAAAASFGPPELHAFRKVRVSVLTTGDELAPPGAPVEPWQIRDSNGPTLLSWLHRLPWVEPVEQRAVADCLTDVESAIREACDSSDAVFLTGGVSMGDTDHVPEAITNLGGCVSFHRLPMRPGRPVLGAQWDGKLIVGLPGNPVSVAVTSRVVGEPLLRRIAGSSVLRLPKLRAHVVSNDEKKLPLIWYRLVEIGSDGRAIIKESRGSGDLVSISRSSGFVEIDANCPTDGQWSFYPW